MSGYEKLAGLMKALAHPVRLQILEALREEEACVCHLEAHLGQRQAYISQQLARLREEGLVVDRRDGMNVYYSLADDALGEVLDAAREALLAVAEESDLTFRPLTRSASCPCPKCRARRGVAVA